MARSQGARQCTIQVAVYKLRLCSKFLISFLFIYSLLMLPVTVTFFEIPPQALKSWCLAVVYLVPACTGHM